MHTTEPLVTEPSPWCWNSSRNDQSRMWNITFWDSQTYLFYME